jgi:hypothetical protein
MAYDDDVTLQQMRAELQNQYDDGASLLGQDPNMQPVGFFGKGAKPKLVMPPVDLQRRMILGLPESSTTNLPAVRARDIPVPTSSITPTPQPIPQAPIQSAPQAAPQPANPLGQLANKALNAPVTRRQVLQRAASAAIQSQLPVPKATDIVKEITSPLVEAAMSPAPAIALPEESVYLFKRALLNKLREYDYVAGRRASLPDKFVSHINKYLPIVNTEIMPEERRNSIAELLKDYNANATSEDAKEKFSDPLHDAVSDIVDALPDSALATTAKEFEHDYQLWENLIDASDSRPSKKLIARTLKDLNIPFDAEGYKQYINGEHY